MKMSDVFDLPLQKAVNELAVIDKNGVAVGWADAFAGEVARDCLVEAVNNHDRLVDANERLTRALSEIIDFQCIDGWEKYESLLKELGHEI